MGSPSFTPATTLSPFALLAPGARAQPDPQQKQAAAYLQLALSGDPIGQGYGNKSEQTSHFSGVIHLAIKAYMDSIGGARYRVFEKKTASQHVRSQPSVQKAMAAGQGAYVTDEDYEPADPEHPLCKVIEQPGGEDGVWSFGQECTYLTLQHMLTGDAPAYLPRNEAGKPVRFYALTSALLQTATPSGIDPRYPKGSYRVTPYGYSGVYAGGMGMATGAILPGEEVARFREPHPWARNIGYSRLEAHRNEIDVLEAITRSRWNYFNTGLMCKTLVMIPGATEETTKKVKKDMTERHGGVDKAGEVMIVGGDPMSPSKMTVQQLGPPIAEMDYPQSYGPAARYVLGVFRVPGVIVGLEEGGGSYSADWAAQRRFYDIGLHPYGRNLSVFATQALARPWSEYHGQYKVECEVPEPTNVEEQAKEQQFALQAGAITVNQYLKATGRETVPEGEVPLPVYLQKLAPPPPPQMLPPGAMAGMPGTDGSAQQPGAPVDGAPQAEDAQAEGEDSGSPQETQDAVASAALEALGVPASQESGVRSQESGQTEQPPAGQQHPANPHPVGSSRWHEEQHRRQGGRFVKKALPPPTKPGSRQQRAEGSTWQVNGRWFTKRGGKILHIAAPGTQKPTSAPLVAPPAGTPMSAAVAPWGLGTTGGPQEFAGSPVHPDAVAKAAAKVPNAHTPTAQKTLLSVDQWAHHHADKHADRVAQHFGISREQAHALLIHAITAVAQHAQKTGGRGATGTMQVNGKQLRVTQKPTGAPSMPQPANKQAAGSGPPQAKAMSSVDDSAGGFLVPPADCAQPVNRMRRKRKKRASDVLARVLKAMEGE